MYRISHYGYRYEHPLGFTVDRPYGIAEHLLVLFRSNVEIFLPGGEVRTERPSVIIYSKNTKHLYSGNRTPMVADWIHFDADESDFPDRLGLEFNTVYYPENAAELSGMIGVLQQNEMRRGPYSPAIADHLVSCFLLMLAQDIHASEKSHIDVFRLQELIGLREEIYSNPQKDWSIDLLSQRMYLSRSHFQMLYSKAFGITPMNDVISSRIRYAKYLLSTTPGITVESAAGLCGYNSPVHFIRQFKTATGKTPLQYKKEFDR